MVSFFPSDFDPQAKVVLLAGMGDYSRAIWESMQKQCPNSVVFSFEEERTAWLKDLPEERCFSFNIGQLGQWLGALKKQKARYVILAGQVQPQRLFQGLVPDLKAILLLATLKEKNATTIFSTLIREIEKLEIGVLDARCFVEDLLVTPGCLTPKVKPSMSSDAVAHGVKVCQGIAALDIGQSVVVRNGTTIAVEGFDGTDAMIEHAGTICNKEMGLIKLAKDTQDFRFDVPTFGAITLEKMNTAGIRWAVLDSYRTVILNKDAVLEKAQQYGIYIEGLAH